MLSRLIAGFGLFIFFWLSAPSNAFAITDLWQTPNNKFGIHLAFVSPEDLADAANLVNSSGGDWGYITVVMENKDLNHDRWQQAFDQMRELHLIPIVRLATTFSNGSWQKPNPEQAKQWATFLDSLNWPVKNRYLVLFNEPNHANEWGGEINPREYGQTALAFTKELKAQNPDFFIMLAGLDAAAPHKLPDHEDEEVFLHQMFASLPNWGEELATNLDGWASHSYPNHGFVGTPEEWGRNSIRTYTWEVSLLKRYNINKKLPVFITETGWPHAEGIKSFTQYYPQEKVNNYFRLYFEQLTQDGSIVAITPFVLNYQGEPFDHFSWRKTGDRHDFYSHYETVRAMDKEKGQPVQNQKLTILNKLPSQLTENSTYQIPIQIRNDGQAIWSKEDDYELKVSGDTNYQYLVSDLNKLKPFEQETVWLYLKTRNDTDQVAHLTLGIAKNGQMATEVTAWDFRVRQAPGLEFKVSLFPKTTADAQDYKMVIYDQGEKVVFERSNLAVIRSQGKIEKIYNLALGEPYRVVLLKDYYLPEQEFITLKEGTNTADFHQLWPFDLNKDGHFSFKDILAGFFHQNLRSLYWP